MAILCPYCRHSMTVKDAKPGKYKPKCAKCGKRFGLTIAADAAQPPLVEALAAEPPGATLPPVAPANKTVVEATLPPAAPRASAAGQIAPNPPAPGPQTALTQPERAHANTLPSGGNVSTRADGAPAPRPAAEIPAQIGGYRILRELGRGAM